MRLFGDSRGFALVAVLGAVLILALIATSLGSISRTDLHLARQSEEATREHLAAEAAINRGLLELLNEAPVTQPFHGRRIVYEYEGIAVSIRIEDEAGRIDLNSASPAVLSALFQAVGTETDTANALADRVADWRDSDDLVRPNGAERTAYRAQGIDGPANRQFLTIAEFEDVFGSAAANYACLQPYLTIFSGRQSPDPRFMDSGLRSVLSRSTEPDYLRAPTVNSNSPAAMSPIGRVYRITATVDAEAGYPKAMVAIVRVTGNRLAPYWVLSWTRAESLEPAGCITD